MAKKVTIYTISKELGLSPGTVSRALNNHPSISAATRARVKPVAEKYNFKPRLVSTKPLNICMLIQKIQGHPLGLDEYVALTMEGVAEYCHDEKLELSIYSGFAEEMNKSDIVRELRRRTADAAMIIRPTVQSDYIKQMDKQKFPYFCLAPKVEGVFEQGLFLDYEQMGYLATKYLLSLGHRKIGMIADSMNYVSVVERYNGYVRALKEEGLAPNKKMLYVPEEPDLNSLQNVMLIGVKGMEALKKRVPGMTAVFSIDDKIAYGAMSWLQKNKVSIPKQMSVIGISDYPSSEFACPPLTTIKVPYKEIGYECARQIHRLCKKMDVCIRSNVLKTFEPQLIVRESCGVR